VTDVLCFRVLTFRDGGACLLSLRAGGCAVVQGSHKANLPTPRSICALDKYAERVSEVNAKKGDVILFCEACIHGALPWRADHQRRYECEYYHE
jgi:ectoine hydroxylase-related dioxygenase (phytanoyl-CoA dioxygenase family)